MREDKAIKKCVSRCCHSPTNDYHSSFEIQKWLQRRRSQHTYLDSKPSVRRRRVHRGGFVFERRENPISGLRSYWRPLKASETAPVVRPRNNSSKSKYVPVIWRKSSESVTSTDSSSQCAVWQCYKRPPLKPSSNKDTKTVGKENEKGKKMKERIQEKPRVKAEVKNQDIPQKISKATNTRHRIHRIERPKVTTTLHDSSTQTLEENVSNTNKETETVSESGRPDSEDRVSDDVDIREYMKDVYQDEGPDNEEQRIAEKLRQMKIEEEKAKKREEKRKNEEFIDRGTRFARAITIAKEDSVAPSQRCNSPKKCPSCGFKIPEGSSSSSDENSVSSDDSRLDQVVENARWAIERRAEIHKLFLLDNNDLER